MLNPPPVCKVPIYSWELKQKNTLTRSRWKRTRTPFSFWLPGVLPPQPNSRWIGPATSRPSWPCWAPAQTGMWVYPLRICAPRSVVGSRGWCRTWSLGTRARTAAWRTRWVLVSQASDVGCSCPGFPITHPWDNLPPHTHHSLILSSCLPVDLVFIATFSTSSACLLASTFTPSLTFSHSASVKLFMCHHPSHSPLTALNVYPCCPRHEVLSGVCSPSPLTD